MAGKLGALIVIANTNGNTQGTTETWFGTGKLSAAIAKSTGRNRGPMAWSVRRSSVAN